MKKITLLITLMITSLGFAQLPGSAAPTPPARVATDVISIYGSEYTNISGVNTNPNWSQSTVVTEVAISGNNTLQYANFNYQGTDWSGTPQNISGMEFLHVDVWTNAQSPRVFVISSGTEISTTISSVAGSWQSLNIPVSGITGNLTNAIQFKFDGGSGGTIYLDNLYFWRAAAPVGTPVIGPLTVPAKNLGDAPFNLTAPTSNSPGAFSYTSSNTSVATISGNTVTIVGAGTSTITAIQAASGAFLTGNVTASLVVSEVPLVAAPTPPVRISSEVISLFSNAYTNIAIDSWSAPWDDSDIVDVQIAGNDAKKITFGNFLGVDFSGAGNHKDASTMTHFHMDFWLPNTVDLTGKVMNPKFSQWGGTSGEVSALLLTYLPTEKGTWVSIDAPLTTFAGNQNRNDLAQFILSSNTGIAYIDNLYLYKAGVVEPPVPSEVPLTAAPTPPVRNAWDVISLFSNAYSNIVIDSWSAPWDDSSQEDVVIVGNDTKKITFGNFLGVDFSGAGHHQNATAMTKFHMDFWLPTSVDLTGKVINPKFSQWGGTSGEVSSLLLTYLPTAKGTWVSIDADLSTFAGNQNRNDIAQFLISSNTGIAYIDNIYLYRPATLGTTQFDRSNVKMYPNPVKNTLTIEANASINKVSIYNILGQEVMVSSPKTNATTLQTSSLQKGVYVVKTDIDGAISTSKIIKE
ncbi:T9SS type A sorting domain-containing protein [Flavobacterium sp.]|uniref:T9SS type A sorting domain-containing protein n=1 Tax=Flavobacterium sp. TaxID=239 RepID=UPI00286AF460|nr:T9SS type A sorting domain-containing protein [Flavobacterium sp.]